MQQAKKGGGLFNTSKMLQCDSLQREVAQRLASDAVRHTATTVWRAWSAEEVTVADAEDSAGTFPASPPSRKTTLTRRLADVLKELRGSFTQKPFSDTLTFVCVDWPETAAALEGWVAVVERGRNKEWETSALVPAPYRRVGFVEAIETAYPAMKAREDAAEFLDAIILPFRMFVQCQVVAFMLDAALATSTPPPTDGAAAAAGSPRRIGPSDTMPPKPPAAPENPAPLTAAQRHAGSHLEGGDALVRHVDDLVRACDAGGLRRVRDHCRKRGMLHRYVEYRLLYFDLDAETTSDQVFASRLRPMADAGLAFAQCDLGQLLLKMALPSLAASTGSLPPSPNGVGRISPGASTYPAPATAALLPRATTTLEAPSKDASTSSPPPAPASDPRLLPLQAVMNCVTRGATRGGATTAASEVQGVDYLQRASRLGHNEARLHLARFHADRAQAILRQACKREPALLRVPMVRTSSGRGAGAGHSRTGSNSTPPASAMSGSGTPQGPNTPSSSFRTAGGRLASPPSVAAPGGSGSSPASPPSASGAATASAAWEVAVRYHLNAAAGAVDELASDDVPLWEYAEHEDIVSDARKVRDELEASRRAFKTARRTSAPGRDSGKGTPEWVKRALGGPEGSSTFDRLMRTWRILLFVALTTAFYMAYRVYWEEPTCPAERARRRAAAGTRVPISRR